MTEAPQGRPELVGQLDLSKMLGESINTIHSWRHRGDHDKLPPPDAVVSGTPVWLKARWDNPGQPLPELPPVVGVKEVAKMFDVDSDTVSIWFRRNNGAPEAEWKVGRMRIWTIPPWEEFARKTGRPITLPEQ
ncbi:hypothetical protein [Nonomuraea sp. NPDC052265]|uniref:hypothetical protein n=1 Tax=Nonomuraea sp. NPDC052265 TaxID=3364374 RepID=UPI0037C895D4